MTAGRDRERNVLPRWRAWRQATLLGETQPLTTRVEGLDSHRSLAEATYAWSRDGGSSRALEVVAAGVGSGVINGEVRQAARSIIDDPQATSLQRAVALTSLGPVHADAPRIEQFEFMTDQARGRIRELRQAAQQFPRNPLLWTDLAREWLIVGEERKALRAMENALALAPESRFVIRSAVRCLVHTKDVGRARHLLRRHASSQDPWILAAALSLPGDPAVSNRSARATLRNLDVSPWHTSELAAALGTREFGGGKDREGRRLIRQALQRPTENALAQATWASATHDFQMEGDWADVAVPYEAQARLMAASFKWSEAAAASMAWLADQPFSEDASASCSYYAMQADRPDLAVAATTQGLVASPDSETLLNNRAFAYASMWRLDDAAKDLNAIDVKAITPRTRGFLLATAGFIFFRGGREVEGRRYYEHAIRHFARIGEQEASARAAVHLAAEETRVGSSDAARARSRAKSLADQAGAPDLLEAWRRLCMTEHPSATGAGSVAKFSPLDLPAIERLDPQD